MALTVPAVRISALSKSFDLVPALRGVDLEIASGESTVILGPNGAGKTTLLKILATIVNPSSGSVAVEGLDYKRDASMVRRRLGLVSHQSFLYGSLTVYENLEFYGRMYDVPDVPVRIEQLITKVGMNSRLQSRVNTLSRGMQQRVAIARALLPGPSVILLDEPETGLDQQAMTMLWEILDGEVGHHRTVIMTTHNLERALVRGDRIVIMHRGRVVFQAKRRDLDVNRLQSAYREHTEVPA